LKWNLAGEGKSKIVGSKIVSSKIFGLEIFCSTIFGSQILILKLKVFEEEEKIFSYRSPF
jgi:hypothetical protein